MNKETREVRIGKHWIAKLSSLGEKQTAKETKHNLDLIMKSFKGEKLSKDVTASFTDWLPLESSNMYGFRYDNDIQVMEVQFRDKFGDASSVYRYDNVPLEMAHALNDAISHGSFFYWNIRTAYPYERLY